MQRETDRLVAPRRNALTKRHICTIDSESGDLVASGVHGVQRKALVVENESILIAETAACAATTRRVIGRRTKLAVAAARVNDDRIRDCAVRHQEDSAGVLFPKFGALTDTQLRRCGDCRCNGWSVSATDCDNKQQWNNKLWCTHAKLRCIEREKCDVPTENAERR